MCLIDNLNNGKLFTKSEKEVINIIKNNKADFTLPFQEDEPTWQIINSISNVYKDSINLINSELDITELEKICTLLNDSNRVFVFGNGNYKITVMTFINKLVKIGEFFILATENNE